MKKATKATNEHKQPHEKEGCRGFHQLKDYQTSLYKKEVQDNSWYMGERLGRTVEWKEAEADFLKNGYYGSAKIWRNQFCTDQCPFFQDCQLGKRFCKK